MTPFTDADLKRLKEVLEMPCTDLPQVTEHFREYERLIWPLIARLEAAEKVCDEVIGLRHIDPEIMNPIIGAWRQVAGKDSASEAGK
jgi:hypothetical protein